MILSVKLYVRIVSDVCPPSQVDSGGHTLLGLLLRGRRRGLNPASSYAQNLPSLRRWRFEMKVESKLPAGAQHVLTQQLRKEKSI